MADTVSWDDLYQFIDEVKAMARGLLSKEQHAASLQTTALVLTALRRQRQVDQDWSTVTWQNRHHFYGAMYQAMQRALIDHARKRAAHKRAGERLIRPEDFHFLDLKQTLETEPAQVVALVDALVWLAQEQPQWAVLIEHRFYGGLTLFETARVMGVSPSTAQRWWQRARLLLHHKVASLLNEEVARTPGS